MRQFTLSDPGYEHLLRILTGQAKVEKNALGQIPDLTTKRAPADPLSAASPVRVDISRITEYAPAELIGREPETQLLNDAWDKTVYDEKGRPRVLTFVALGGKSVATGGGRKNSRTRRRRF